VISMLYEVRLSKIARQQISKTFKLVHKPGYMSDSESNSKQNICSLNPDVVGSESTSYLLRQMSSHSLHRHIIDVFIYQKFMSSWMIELTSRRR
jgi:hypothetical protein